VQQYTTGPLVGTPEQIVDRLKELQDEGMTYAIANFHEAAYDDDGIRLYAEQVMPALA
jgi:alkanesulfonate monooxygenase SsuD/methylene tetrahydromethanopterin reductase-like flavin-dependent oxidoreductase (luciferase family)